MENDQKALQEIKILKNQLSLGDFGFFLKPIIDDEWAISGEFIAEPENLEPFSLKFQSVYWYLQYHLLRDKFKALEKESLEIMLSEKNVFYDTITLENTNGSRKLHRIDGGSWVISFFKDDDIVEKLHQLQMI